MFVWRLDINVRILLQYVVNNKAKQGQLQVPQNFNIMIIHAVQLT